MSRPAGDKILYFDCYSGISGDMTLGALLDCGVELHRLQEILSGLPLAGYSLQARKVKQYGLSGVQLSVRLEAADHKHRRLSEITELIEAGDLPARVKEQSLAVFRSLAAAEAAVHGVEPEQVHFHEVGAVDAIVDIVGSACALYLLGVEQIYCSPLPMARGEVKAAHGLLPLPAPAVLELLKRRGVPVYGKDLAVELVTPTGAAIVAALAAAFGPLPALSLEAIGYGAGSLDPGYPNFLRLLLGRASAEDNSYTEPAKMIEANIDDLNPEIYGYLLEKLFQAGALDVYFTPIQMKKNRPAVMLSVLARPDKLRPLSEIIFHETSTLGMRVTDSSKIMRPRETVTVETPWGPVKIKVVPGGAGDLQPPHFAPEYEDCLAIARRTGLSLKEIYRCAEFIFQQRFR